MSWRFHFCFIQTGILGEIFRRRWHKWRLWYSQRTMVLLLKINTLLNLFGFWLSQVSHFNEPICLKQKIIKRGWVTFGRKSLSSQLLTKIESNSLNIFSVWFQLNFYHCSFFLENLSIPMLAAPNFLHDPSLIEQPANVSINTSCHAETRGWKIHTPSPRCDTRHITQAQNPH